MQKKWIWFIPAAIVGGIVFVAVGGFVVQWLWNWLLPPLFGWHVLTFWQALGMLVLCRILFGGLGHGGHGKHRRHRDGGRCNGRTQEEREQFRQQMREDFRERMRQRWGTPTTPPGPAPQA